MDIRLHKQVKTSYEPSAPVQTVFRKKQSFGVQVETAPVSSRQHPTPDLQSQLNRSARFGHHFSRLEVHGSNAAGVQTKLTVGKPGDKYEQEADRVADQVMAMSMSNSQQQVQRQATEEEEVQAKFLTTSIAPAIQLQAEEEHDEEKLQTKSLGTSINPEIQRQAGEEDEEEQVQTKPTLQRASTESSSGSGSSLESRLVAQRGGGSPMSNDIRAFMQPRFGINFSQVRVHTGSDAVQMNRELNAQAFAHGHDIYFGAGKYNPGSSEGKHLLAHELTHVVQQTGGG